MRKWIARVLSLCVLATSMTGPVYGSEIIEESGTEECILEEVVENIEDTDSSVQEEHAEEEANDSVVNENSEQVHEGEDRIPDAVVNEENSEITEESDEIQEESLNEETIEIETPETETYEETEKEDIVEEPVYGPDNRTQEILDLQSEILSYEDIAVYGVANLEYTKQLAKFPESYRLYIEVLHEKYPNWGFKAIETGLDWSEAVNAESTGGRSLIYYSAYDLLRSNASGDYNPATGQYIAKDGTQWFTASRSAVAYFMDPRNFLNEQYIMMFEANTFDQAYQTKAGVEAILDKTFMSHTAIEYLDAKGNTIKAVDANGNPVTYGETIWTAGGMTNVSPLYLASKIRQEIGSKQSASVNGKHATYPGIYNYYNIGAYSSADPVSNGLKWASLSNQKPEYQRPWTSPILSIYGGAEYIGEEYILQGQNTGYFMRFNVNPESSYSTYNHQYMTNISGAATEAYSTYKSYLNLGILADAKIFYIPVYENMPDKNADIRIDAPVKSGSIEHNVNIRKQPTNNSAKVVTAAAGTKMEILGGEIWSDYYSSTMLIYPYWYKVRFTQEGNEYTGYLCAEYVTLDPAYTLKTGETKQLKLSSGKSEAIYYETSDPAIVTVDKNGVVKGISEGQATLYAISGNGRMDAVGIKVAGEISSVSYTVTWDAAGGTLDTPTTQYEEGASIGALPTPVRENYVFQGWFTAKKNGTKIQSTKIVTESATFYAQWKKSITASTVKVSSISTQAFKNKALTPSVTVKDGNKTLVKGTHYTVSYSKNKLPGTATVTIKGTGSYTGSRKITFKIKETLVKYKTTANLNYRKGAGTSYAKAGTITKGKTVQIVSGVTKKANGYTWYLIKVNSKYYYAASTYLKKVSTTTAKETLVKYKTTANLNYRKGAGTSYATVGTLKKGKTVEVVNGYSKKANGYTWYKIKISGKYYYAVSGYLKKVTTAKKTLVTYKTTENLNYRTGAGTSYQVAGTITKGKNVSVVNGYSKKANGYTWYKIKVSGKYYYAVSTYLKK